MNLPGSARENGQRPSSKPRSLSYLNILREQNEQMLGAVAGQKASNFGYFKDQIRDIDKISGRGQESRFEQSRPSDTSYDKFN